MRGEVIPVCSAAGTLWDAGPSSPLPSPACNDATIPPHGPLPRTHSLSGSSSPQSATSPSGYSLPPPGPPPTVGTGFATNETQWSYVRTTVIIGVVGEGDVVNHIQLQYCSFNNVHVKSIIEIRPFIFYVQICFS